MVKKRSDLSKEIADKQAQLRQILADNRVELSFSIERYNPRLKPEIQEEEFLMKDVVAEEFHTTYTKHMDEDAKNNLTPFYKKSITYGGKASPNNLALVSKDLASFLEVLIEEFTTEKYSPVLHRKVPLITGDYSYLQNGYLHIQRREQEKIFLEKIMKNEKNLSKMAEGLEPDELEALKKGYIPYSLRVIKIDFHKGYVADNLLLTRRAHSKLIIKNLENCNLGFIEKLKNDQIFLRIPYATKPPASTFLMELNATFNPDKLKEIGITEELAEEIALKRVSRKNAECFFDRYKHCKKTLKLKNGTMSGLYHLDKYDAELLVELLINDKRYSKNIEIVFPLNEEDAIRAYSRYQNIVPYFLKMCATSSKEKQKLINLGLSDTEIMMMKHGFRFSRVIENGVKSRTTKPKNIRLTIHHIIPRSFGKFVMEENEELVAVPPDRKDNLILLHEELHRAIHAKYDQQTGSIRKIIDFTKFGYVMDHIALMKEYGIPVQEQEKIIPKKQFTPIWQLISSEKVQSRN